LFIIISMKKVLNIVIFLYFVFCAKKEIGVVDNLKMYEEDIKDIQKIELAYGREVSKEEALLILIKKLIDIRIAEKMGIKIEEGDIIKEEQRFVKESLAPEILERIFKSLEENREKYRRLFVKPVLARRLLEYKFFTDTLFYQRNSYKKAKYLLKQLKKGIYNKDETYFDFSPQDTSLLYGYLKSRITRENKIKDTFFYKILEDKFTYYPIKVRIKDRKYYIKGYIVRKDDFNEFYREQVERINILVYNKFLKSKILKRVTKTYWEGIIK